MTASISVALAGAAHALVRGSPRADGRAALAGVLTFLVGLVYGTVVTPWFGLVLAAAGIALAVLALRTAVGAYLTRRN